MEDRDRERLVSFIETMKSDLEYVFAAVRQHIDPELSRRLLPAWDAVESREEFALMTQRVESREYDDRLDRAGLSGRELDFKLTGLELARRDGQRSRRPRALKRWLSWIDVPLASLLAVVGAGEGVKELKEGVETALESPPPLGGLRRRILELLGR